LKIIVTKNGKEPERIDESKFRDEDKIQQYIHHTPDSIPLYEIDDDIRLWIPAREFGTNNGIIDAIGLDQYGDLYIIETKLYKNPDRRTVLAQVLDYGAAIAMKRDSVDFILKLEETAGFNQNTLKAEFSKFFEITDDESSEAIDKLKKNIESREFTFVVLMDKLDEKLKNLILFINDNSNFRIFAVELKYFKYENLELTIPKIFGTEGNDNSTISGSRRKWDEKTFFDDANTRMEKERVAAVKKLYDFSKHVITWGTGSSVGSFNAKFEKIGTRSLYTVKSDGQLILNFHWLDDNSQMKHYRDEFKNKMSALKLEIPSDYSDKLVHIKISDWYGKADAIIDGINSLIE